MNRRYWYLGWLLFITTLAACSGAASDPTPTAGSGGFPAGSTPGAEGTAAGRTAEISELRNEVEARGAEADDWQTASEGQHFLEGGGVKTGAESRVRVDISDGTIIRIAANTQFILEQLSPAAENPVTRLVLDAGKLFVSVTRALGGGAFEIESPSGVATVRGSLMSAEYDTATGRFVITCLEGVCRILDRARQSFVDLAEGQQSEISGPGQGPLAARLMTEAQLDDWAEHFPGLENLIARIRQRLGRGDETPTPAPPGSVGSGASGQTACDHPYFPLRAGATWTYANSEGGTFNWAVNSVQGDTANATAGMTWSFAEVSGTYNWQCDSFGVVSYEFGSLAAAGLGQVINYEVLEHAGVFLPSMDLLVPGYAWSNTYTLQYEVTLEGNSIPATAEVSESYEVTGAEPVSVSGQSFDGLQISKSSTRTIEMTMPGGFSVPPITIDETGLFEMARGVGFVRFVASGSGTTSTSQLTSYNIP